jgi:hypothetical protein
MLKTADRRAMRAGALPRLDQRFGIDLRLFFERWYNSPEYQEALAGRLRSAISKAIIIEGYNPSAT